MVSDTLMITVVLGILAAGVGVMTIVTTLLGNRMADMNVRLGGVEQGLGGVRDRLTTLEVKLGER